MKPVMTPFSFEGTLSSPEVRECRGEPVPFIGHSAYESQVSYVLDLPPTSGAQVLDFGTISKGGAKMIAVQYDPRIGASPIHIVINDGADSYELSPGGFIVYFSPNPVAGITAISITHSTSGRVRVWIMG